MKNLQLPPGTEHIPAGREYENLEKANHAWLEFEHELEKLTERYGVHAHVFNGALIVKPAFGIPALGSQPYRTVATSLAGGCVACVMFAIAQGMLANPTTNEILVGALKMFDAVFEDESPVAPDLEKMEIKGKPQ